MGKVDQGGLQIHKGDPLVDRQSLDLGKRRGVGRIEGIVAETVGLTCGNCTGLNLYKIVGNGSIGTGPNFADSARLGVAGFNEFFYLNQHPEVAAAIERGEYRSGLDHYLVEGYAKGYAMHAPNARGRR